MKEELINGSAAVGQQWALILALGLANVLLNSVLLRLIWSIELAPVVLVVVAGLSIVIHARIASGVRGEKPVSDSQALRAFALKYLLVVAVTGMPGLLVRYFVEESIHPYPTLVAIRLGVRILTAMLLLYALPLVFYRLQGLGSIRSGALLLADRMPDSSALIGLVAVANLIMALGSTILHFANGSWLVVLGTTLLVAGTYGSIITFAIACGLVLREEGIDQRAIV